MAHLEEEFWIGRFATLLCIKHPTYDRKMALQIGEAVWPSSRASPPEQGVVEFLERLAEASAELIASDRRPAQD